MVSRNINQFSPEEHFCPSNRDLINFNYFSP